MSTTNFWVYDIERGYIRLIDQVAERADKTHYLYLHHQNITRAATGQQRLTRFTYLQSWRAVNAGHFEPKAIREFILKKKTELAESRGNPVKPVLSIAKKKRDANRALNEEQHRRKQAALQQQSAAALMPSFSAQAFEERIAFVPAENPVEQCPVDNASSQSNVSVSIPDSQDSGEVLRPISPTADNVALYKNLDEAMLLRNLETPELLKIAQMKVCKHLLRGGENICYPMSDFSMDVALTSNGVPCDPDILYTKLEQIAERRSIKFDCIAMYKDLKRAHGHVLFVHRLPSPDCYQFSRY